jgi:hypothetical protein
MADQPTPRRRFQFRLRTLLIAVTAVSFGAAAIRFGTRGWVTGTVSVTVLLVLASVVLAAYRRPFWLGFAVFSSGYLMLTVSPFEFSKLHYLLFTSQSLQFLLEKLHDYGPYNDGPNQFLIMGECLWAIIIGFTGGMLAQFVAGRSCTQS